ncbi:MAG: energy transducer TonB [Armatimonadota bacterium]|nr:energy transducer TonB [bacterium]
MKKDKVLIYAIVASIAFHLIAVSVVGRTSASRLNAAPVVKSQHKLLEVDLVKTPADALQEKPKPIYRPTSEPMEETRPRQVMPSALRDEPMQSSSIAPRPISSRVVSSSSPRAHVSSNRLPGNPGGKLNVGSTSANGDLGGNWDGGRTSVGWVSGGDDGRGKGSGSGAGEGRPDPIRNASDGPGTTPAPAPEPPKTVSVRVCDESGMLAGEYCRSTSIKSFIEDHQPSHTCNRCYKSRLADQANPILIKDANISVPASVDEGLSVTVKVEYTVTDDGSVANIDVIKSSGSRALDKAVVSTTSRLKYKPAVQDGVPRSVKMTRVYKINT